MQHLEHLLFYGADMAAQNASGNTALHICALYNQVSGGTRVGALPQHPAWPRGSRGWDCAEGPAGCCPGQHRSPNAAPQTVPEAGGQGQGAGRLCSQGKLFPGCGWRLLSVLARCGETKSTVRYLLTRALSRQVRAPPSRPHRTLNPSSRPISNIACLGGSAFPRESQGPPPASSKLPSSASSSRTVTPL